MINATEPKPKHHRNWGKYLKADVAITEAGHDHIRITYAPALLEAIRELVNEKLVEIQWLTTWEGMANFGLAELIGVGRFPVANTREERLADHSKISWWKFSVAKRLAGQRPLIWTDDDLAGDPDARIWVTSRSWPTLAIAPSYRGGLQPREMDRIRDFALSACAERV